MVIIVAAFIFVLDLAFDYANKFEVEQVKKLQNSIVTENTTNETSENAVDANTTQNSITNETNTENKTE